MTSIYGHIALFQQFCGHFLDVEGNGEEGKVHCYLVLAEVLETFVLHVVLHLSEDRFWFYRAVGAVSSSLSEVSSSRAFRLYSMSRWLTSISLLPFLFL